jgi:hypothetical protein
LLFFSGFFLFFLFHYSPAASTFLSIVYLILKSPHTQNMLLRTEYII